jgi:phosphinothricin acetyltransferase
MVLIRDAVIQDLPAMLDIYNYAIVNLNATFDLEEQTLDQRKVWFNKYGGSHPLIVAESAGEVAGYCSLSPFSPKEAYSKTAEVSIYISEKHQGKGMGRTLLTEILERAKQLDFHSIIAIITSGNESSVKLHEKFGFTFIGRLQEVGYKFDQWQDVDYFQLLLNR